MAADTFSIFKSSRRALFVVSALGKKKRVELSQEHGDDGADAQQRHGGRHLTG